MHRSPSSSRRSRRHSHPQGASRRRMRAGQLHGQTWGPTSVARRTVRVRSPILIPFSPAQATSVTVGSPYTTNPYLQRNAAQPQHSLVNLRVSPLIASISKRGLRRVSGAGRARGTLTDCVVRYEGCRCLTPGKIMSVHIQRCQHATVRAGFSSFPLLRLGACRTRVVVGARVWLDQAHTGRTPRNWRRGLKNRNSRRFTKGGVQPGRDIDRSL